MISENDKELYQKRRGENIKDIKYKTASNKIS